MGLRSIYKESSFEGSYYKTCGSGFLLEQVVLIYVGILSQTSMEVCVEDGNIICHQMKDDYCIPISDIDDITIESDSGKLKLRKEAGYDMDPKYKGKYCVNDESEKVYSEVLNQMSD